MLAQSTALGNWQIKTPKPQRGGTEAKRGKGGNEMERISKHFVPPLQGLMKTEGFLPRPLAWANIELRLRREKVVVEGRRNKSYW
jgi:hypothetical protein